MNKTTNSDVDKRLIEKMAAMEHTRWSKWQKYMHSKILPTEHDALMQISTEWIERWNRQVNTKYEDLTETEKESDREQVYPYIEIIHQEILLAQQQVLRDIVEMRPKGLINAVNIEDIINYAKEKGLDII